MPDMVEKRDKALRSLAGSLGVDLTMDVNTGLCPYNPGSDLFVNWKGQVSPCRYSHLPVVNDHYTFYKNGKLQHVRPLNFGYLVDENQLKRWQQRTNRLIRLFSSSTEPSSITSCLPKTQIYEFRFRCQLPHEEPSLHWLSWIVHLASVHKHLTAPDSPPQSSSPRSNDCFRCSGGVS